MKIRRAIPTDVSALSRLRWTLAAEQGERPDRSYAAFAARYAAFVRAGLASGEWAYFVAEEAGEIVAHAGVRVIHAVPRPSRAAERWGWVADAYTAPEWRERGVGERLLGRVTAWARERGLARLQATPGERARGLYERAGFAAGGDVMTLRLRGDVSVASEAAREHDAPGEQQHGEI